MNHRPTLEQRIAQAAYRLELRHADLRRHGLQSQLRVMGAVRRIPGVAAVVVVAGAALWGWTWWRWRHRKIR